MNRNFNFNRNFCVIMLTSLLNKCSFLKFLLSPFLDACMYMYVISWFLCSVVWEAMQHCRGSFTANHTSSSSSRVKGTTTRGSDASSIRSSGPLRMQRASPSRHNPQWFPKLTSPSTGQWWWPFIYSAHTQ